RERLQCVEPASQQLNRPCGWEQPDRPAISTGASFWILYKIQKDAPVEIAGLSGCSQPQGRLSCWEAGSTHWSRSRCWRYSSAKSGNWSRKLENNRYRFLPARRTFPENKFAPSNCRQCWIL